MSVEERVRAAAQAAAGQVREIRPLDLSPARLPRSPLQLTRRTPAPLRRWRGWLVPLAAAAAVILIAIGLAITHQVQNGPATPLAPPSPSPTVTQQQPTTSSSGACGNARSAAKSAPPNPLPGDVPQYFVELCGGLSSTGRNLGAGRLVAADIRTGAVLGSVPAPSGKDMITGIYGTDDNQAFVVSASRGTPKGPQTDLWMLRLAPGTAHPVALVKLPWTLDDKPLSIAVSPDGTKIAASLNATVPGSPSLEPVKVYSLATGRVLRSWTFNGLVDALEWTGDGNALAYQGDSQTFLVHPITAPGSDLAAGSRPLLTLAPTADAGTACGGASDWLVTSDGTMIICGHDAAADMVTQRPQGIPTRPVTAPQAHVSTVRIGATTSAGAGHCKGAQLGFDLFAAGSHLPGSSPAGTDYSVTDPCASSADVVSLVWACSDGTQVIGQVSYAGHDEVGVFYDNMFVPVPVLGSAVPQEPWMIAF